MGKALIAIDQSGSYRVYLTISTDLVANAAEIHMTTPVATAALGRTLTGAGLMGIMLKGEDNKLTVSFKGEGPARQILATAYADGRVKGYISNPEIDLPLKANGKLDVGAAVGAGEMKVIKDLGMREPYIGSAPIISGEIAEDFTNYFYVSEQQKTSVALGVKIGRDAKVLCAGGMVIQMLPDHQEEAVDALEDMLRDMKPITTLIEEEILRSAGKSPEGVLESLLENIFGGMPEFYRPRVLEYRDIFWQCDCSEERLAQALMTIGKKDLQEIIDEDGHAELVCQFCEKRYQFNKEQLLEILERIK